MDEHLTQDIHSYWDERAQSYSNGVLGELADERRTLWAGELQALSRGALGAAAAEGRRARICDLGCGPGFFSILYAALGCHVDAVDASNEMIRRACANVAAANEPGSVAFHVSDLATLPFPDNTFDACVSRNVTWLMQDPEAAYAEWLRVLRPGGTLIAFDANWYRYLVDPALAAAREQDISKNRLEGWDEDAQATSDEEKRCEELAAQLPLTPQLRPAWDLAALGRLGARSMRADEDVWQRVWTASEAAYYRTTPQFAIVAQK